MWKRKRTPLGTRRGVAKLLGVSISTIDNWTKAGWLTPIRFGRLVRFDMNQVDALIEDAQADDADTTEL